MHHILLGNWQGICVNTSSVQHSQVEALEAELSGARKSAAGKASEMANLSKRLSDSLARVAKLDDKVSTPALTYRLTA